MSRWFWDDPNKLSSEDEFHQMKDWYNTVKSFQPRPDFDMDYFEKQCKLVEEHIEDLYKHDTTSNVDIGALKDYRVDIIKGYFRTYAHGKMTAEAVYYSAYNYLRDMADSAPTATLFGLGVAVAGFNAMYAPDLAEPFGSIGAWVTQQLHVPRRALAVFLRG